MVAINIRKPFTRERFALTIEGESLTKQSHKRECDVNLIIKQYNKTGAINHLVKMEARYGEMTGLDFHTAMNIVAEGQSAFEALPSEIRKRFRNDPAQFLDFCADPKNNQELIDLKLATPELVKKLHTADGAIATPPSGDSPSVENPAEPAEQPAG